MAAHKVWTTIIVLIILVGGYYIYRRSTAASVVPQYVLSPAHIGTLTQTVSGSGQVSASNQTDITSLVSGTIRSIDVSVGQSVHTGQLIATIDPTTAAASLKNAKLSLAKLVEPPKTTDLSNTQSSLVKSYNDGFSSAAAIYLDLPTIMSGMKSMLYGQGGFLSPQESSSLTTTAVGYLTTAGQEYDAAAAQYQKSLAEFQGLQRSSATSSIDAMLADTYTTIKDVAQAVTDTQNTVTYITANQPDYQAKNAATAAANVNTWSSQANSDLSNLVSAQNSIQTSQNSLSTLLTGADSLDVQSAELSVQQAQQTYDNYFIRAPYDGIIGRIPVNVYNQAGGSTVIATIIGAQKIATISLDEVDAANVRVGQPVAITFDAITGLTATGTVEEVDQIGTVTSGVVSYGIKILINTQDDRIKPGMSVNTTITTKMETGVLLVSISAVKTQGTKSYVQVFPSSVLTALRPAGTASTATSTRFGSTTRQFGGQASDSTTSPSFTASSTSTSTSSHFAGGQTPTVTISSATAPQQVAVTIGDSDSTNIVIESGLNPGQLVVTRTIGASSATSAAAPSILSSLSGNRTAGAGAAAGGGARTFSGGGGAATGAAAAGR